MRRTAATLAVTLVVLPAVSGCAGGPSRVDSAWPLVYYARGPGHTELEALGPLVFYQRGPEATSYGLRPLVSVHREHGPGRSSVHLLYPLSYFRAEPKARRDFVFPLYYHHWRITPGGQPLSQTVVFPLFWWGRHPEGGRWFLVLFLGGTAKGLLGKDEILYGGFTYMKERTGDYVVRHYVWPLVSVGRGGGRRSLRLWPFFGHARQEGQWWNGYVLWPFVTYGAREASRTKPAARFWSLWPLVGRSRSRDGRSGSYQVLWPLFFYAWGERGYREWRMPFPIVVGKRSEDVASWNVWPLFGRRRHKGGHESFVLWPLVHYARLKTARKEREDVKVFPLFTRVRRSDAKRGSRHSYGLLYPLWRSRSWQVGEARGGDANSLQLAWFANSAGFDRNYNALFGLFEHGRWGDGRRATRVLWRAFRSERGPGSRFVQLGPLVSWRRSGNLTRTSFMLGLVQTGRNNGKRGWRIGFVPFGASLSRPSGPPVKEGTRGHD